MDSSVGVVLPQHLADLVAQRNQLWASQDEAARCRDQLDRLAANTPVGGVSSPLPPLTRTDAPPDELAVAVKSLQGELETINRLRADLREAEQRRFQAILIGVACGVVGVVIAIIALLAAFGGRR